jgi:DNA polymerase-3 subunit alpha
MSECLPIFKSQYSLGKSILTLNKQGESSKVGPDSIIDICADNDIKELYLVDDNMSGFLQAYSNCEEAKIKLIFGLKILIGTDKSDKTEDSLKKFSKFIVFARNKEGYKKLIKIYSDASVNGFYYTPRSDFKFLKSVWSEDDLSLCVPFYDSFIFKNVIENYTCVPELDFTEPTFFIENNNLPFDNVIKSKVIEYTENKKQLIKSKSIYYKNKKDFMSYLTFRCINNRSSLQKPNLEHMCSNEFCFEEWAKDDGAL